MTDGFALLGNGSVVLSVGPVQSPFAIGAASSPSPTLVQKELRLSQILLVSRDAVELAESDFDFLMSGWVRAAVFVEDLADQIGVL